MKDLSVGRYCDVTSASDDGDDCYNVWLRQTSLQHQVFKGKYVAKIGISRVQTEKTFSRRGRDIFLHVHVAKSLVDG